MERKRPLVTLTDDLVYELIFQMKISLLPYVFVPLARKPHAPANESVTT